jgi:hypothetical protein
MYMPRPDRKTISLGEFLDPDKGSQDASQAPDAIAIEKNEDSAPITDSSGHSEKWKAESKPDLGEDQEPPK